jgi:hypothetical protein
MCLERHEAGSFKQEVEGSPGNEDLPMLLDIAMPLALLTVVTAPAFLAMRPRPKVRAQYPDAIAPQSAYKVSE